jgi:hypothetical protein
MGRYRSVFTPDKKECASYIKTWSKEFSVLPQIKINSGL